MKYQQGDVLLKVVTEKIGCDEELNHLVLAEGEATGHRHQIVSGVAKLIVFQKMMYLKVLSDSAKLKHQEHNEIDLPRGTYQVGRVREFDPFENEIRKVAD